jgi:GGDEF domain-containing protein
MDRADDPRRASRDRLRAGFQYQAIRQLRELGSLFETPASGPVRDTVTFELERMATIAHTFGMTEVESAAREASLGVAAGGGRERLVALATTFWAIGMTTRFPPIVVVAQAAQLTRLQAEAQRMVEPILLFASLEAARSAVIGERPQAMVVPSTFLTSLTEVEQKLTIFAYGPEDVAARRAAITAGAIGYLEERWELRHLLERVRTRTGNVLDGPPKVLLDSAIPRLDAMTDALSGAGIEVGVADVSGHALRSVKDASADLVVVSSAAADAVKLVRAHHLLGSVMIASVGPSSDALLAGADLHLSGGRDPIELLTVAVQRARERIGGRDPLTGVPARSEGLGLVDRMIADAQRGLGSGVVAVVELDMGESVLAGHPRGSAAQAYALRVLARTLRSGLRINDVVARIGGGTFLVALSGAPIGAARRRLGELRQAFLALGARDERLAPFGFSAGFADLEDGLDGVLHRAEDAMERMRATNARGGIG